jgi:hypothetical protein
MRTTHCFVLALVALAFTAACGGPLRYELRGSPKAPEADAEIVAEINEAARMTKLQITVQHLAPPDRLDEDGEAFVVWARPDSSGEWGRVGALKYDAGERKGELLEASVPESAFDLLVTVEEDASPKSPSSSVVLSQEVHD